MALTYDLVCFSHLRWDFVYQRPQHLLSRCAQERRVFYIEEPIFEEAAYLNIRTHGPQFWSIVPHIPDGLPQEELRALQQKLLDDFFIQYGIEHYVLWYYSPMALDFTEHLKPLAIVYDCTDFIAAIKTVLNEDHPVHLQKVDAFLSQTSWNATWRSMSRLIDETVALRRARRSWAGTRHSPYISGELLTRFDGSAQSYAIGGLE